MDGTKNVPLTHNTTDTIILSKKASQTSNNNAGKQGENFYKYLPSCQILHFPGRPQNLESKSFEFPTVQPDSKTSNWGQFALNGTSRTGVPSDRIF